MEDLCDREVLRERIGRALPDKNLLLDAMGAAGFTVDALVEQAAAWGARLAPHLDDTTWLVQDALRRGDHVLLEGAQGTLLDLDHGSYPFVTSSNPVAGGACTGGGIGPLQVDEVIGVMKAYSTRVGAGPVPDRAVRRHRQGHRGARPRVRHGHRPAAPGGLVRRRADALRRRGQLEQRRSSSTSSTSCPGIETIRLCVAYEIDGKRVEVWPSSGQRALAGDADLRGLPGLGAADPRRPQPADLPENARRYVSALEDHAGVPIVFVSVGPERTQTIERAWRPKRHRPAATA